MRDRRKVAAVVGAVLMMAGLLYWATLMIQASGFSVGTATANFHWLLAELVAIPHAVVGAALIAYSLLDSRRSVLTEAK
jgi:hypothetical protein